MNINKAQWRAVYFTRGPSMMQRIRQQYYAQSMQYNKLLYHTMKQQTHVEQFNPSTTSMKHYEMTIIFW